MQFFFLILLVCFFIFLYCVFVLANDDFIFLRRDVTMEKLFNTIFLGSFFSLFTARFFYGLFYAKDIFSNLLVFLLFPYFPGLSLLGGVVGIGVYFFFLRTRKKDPLPLGRMSDFFSIAFLISLPVGFISSLMFLEKGSSIMNLGIQAVLYFILFIIFLKFLLPKLLSGKIKEGSIALLFLISFSLVGLISNLFPKINFLDYFKNFENLISITTVIASAFLLIKREGFLLRIKELRRKR